MFYHENENINYHWKTIVNFDNFTFWVLDLFSRWPRLDCQMMS